ncbi:hypothetical protein GCM10010172_07160 [Paractinoplanes ferrugineus]|uniref:Uncharacterized protein n=1 Tax=Paractinoplanes ferrugineus TaxID=113564 RepID=A0A919JAN0_9ACTN|nr:hypothetical protein [Actinoplanes ferrugineus]GIE16805.1 hypothetical protein Afe05nite_86450 [Actinoplanes ferrugineus]
MADGSDTRGVKLQPTAVCRFGWCTGRFCLDRPEGELFHQAHITSSGDDDIVGVEIVRNDSADGGTTGTLVDITFADLDDGGVTRHSVSLSPTAALRHAEAVIKAALAALAQ